MTNAHAIDPVAMPRRHHHGKHRGLKAAALLAMAGHARGRGRHGHGHGPGGGGFFFNMPFGGPGGRGKARRGDVRTAVLLLLGEGPLNGYQIMQEIVLQQLEDEGLVRATETDGRKGFELTDAGRDFVAGRGSDAPAPWDEMRGDVSDEVREAANNMRDVALAFSQVARAGSPSQVAEASKILADTRRSLYRILADGEPAEEAAS
jgi:DNA-binding PadR family transcriptional regulator